MAPYISNFDERTGSPRFMFDPDTDPGAPLTVDAATAGEVGFEIGRAHV